METFFKSLNKFRLKGSYCDVFVKGKDGKEHPAHRVMLASASPVFDRELTAHGTTKQPPVILLSDIESDLIDQLLDFIYSYRTDKGKYCQSLMNLCELLEISSYHSIQNDFQNKITNNQRTYNNRKIENSHLEISSKGHEELLLVKQCDDDISDTEPTLDELFSRSKFSDDDQHRCYLCKQKYSTAGNLKRHFLTVHQKIKPFICKFCGKRYGQKVTLQLHIKSTHMTGSIEGSLIDSSQNPDSDLNFSKEGDFTSLNDSLMFGKDTKSDELGFDVLKGSRLNLNSTCHICHKKLSRPSNLKKHLLIHYSSNPLLKINNENNNSNDKDSSNDLDKNDGELKGYSDDSKDNINAKDQTTLENVLGEINHNNVTNYDNSAQNVNQIPSFNCENASTKSVNTSDLSMSIKRFVCEVCGKSFTLGEYLKKHFQSVHNTSSHSCAQCNRYIMISFLNILKTHCHFV